MTKTARTAITTNIRHTRRVHTSGFLYLRLHSLTHISVKYATMSRLDTRVGTFVFITMNNTANAPSFIQSVESPDSRR